MLFTFKLLALLLIGFHWDSAGFSGKEAMATVALVLPLFSVYGAAMFREKIKHQHVGTYNPNDSRVVKSGNAVLYQILMGLYGMAILLVIQLRPDGTLSFEGMQGGLATIETLFGTYIGTIVFSLFEKTEQ